ncbi:MAG: leucine-rich repeat domain-containing protein, partial [Clostridia bacterium]
MDNSKTRIPKTWLMIVLQLCFLFCGLSFAFNTLQKPEIIFADLPSLSYNSIYLDTAYSVSVGTCNNETNIVIPSEFNGKPVKTITEYGFQGCTNLVSITFPETLTVINRFAFYNCTSLLSITIPDSVTDICTEAFYNCTSLSEINFSDKDVCIGGYAFGNTAWLTNSNDGVVYAGKVAYLLKGNMLPETIITLKDGTLSIAMRAFESCNRLMSVVFPEGFENICSYAFLNCSGMTYINFPESLKNIDALAFSGCYNLSEVILPKNINNIGTNAFQSCLLLEKVIVKDFTPCTCGG